MKNLTLLQHSMRIYEPELKCGSWSFTNYITRNFIIWIIKNMCEGAISYFYSKIKQMHQCLRFILLEWHSTCFGRWSFRPSSGVKYCAYRNRHMSNRYCRLLANDPASKQYLFDICLLQYVQSLTPDDGRKDRPKHVECYSLKIN